MSHSSSVFSAERKAISNIICFTNSVVYKYQINYECDELSQEFKRAALVEILGTTNTPFLIHTNNVYFPNAINRHIYTTSWEGTPIKIIFTPKHKISLYREIDVLQLLLQRFVKLEFAKLQDEQIIFDLNINNIKCKNLLCIDFQFFYVQKESFKEAQAAKNLRVCYQNNIYTVYSQAGSILKLKSSSGKIISAASHLCFKALNLEEVFITPNDFMVTIVKLLKLKELKVWNLKFNGTLKVKAQILPPEEVHFGDGVKCTHKNGSWNCELTENEFLNPIELWCWCILYTKQDFLDAHLLLKRMKRLPEDTGVLIGEPLYLEFTDTLEGYAKAINSIVSKILQIIIIFIPFTKNKPERLIRYLCCVKNSIPFLIIHTANLNTPEQVRNLLLKINAILGGTPWTVDFSRYNDTMFCGSDYYAPDDNTKPTVCSLVTNLSDDGISWHSCSEILTGDILSYLICSMDDAISKYCDINGCYPKRIVIYQRVDSRCIETIRTFYEQYISSNNYNNIDLVVIFVRTDSATNFFRTSNGVALNVPPGTVIQDPSITGGNEFYLVSKYSSSTEMSRPTHYTLISDNRKLLWADLLVMTYKICHLDYAVPEICKIPAPLSYARKLSILISEFGVVPKSSDLNEFLYYL